MGDRRLRIIIIDDNPAIQEDFIKVFTSMQKLQATDKLEIDIFDELEPDKNIDSDKENLLPEFQLDTATQGQEGVEKIQQALENGKPYTLAFVDLKMQPGWDGIETIRQMWKVDRDIQVVICTAYTDYSLEETVLKLGTRDNLLILKCIIYYCKVRVYYTCIALKYLCREHIPA